MSSRFFLFACLIFLFACGGGDNSDTNEKTPVTQIETGFVPMDIQPGEILLETEWGQVGDLYNGFCPLINGKRSPAGCVAVAIAQIVYYWGIIGDQSLSRADRYVTEEFEIRIDEDYRSYDFSSFSELNDIIWDREPQDYYDLVPALIFTMGILTQSDYRESSTGADFYADFFDRIDYENEAEIIDCDEVRNCWGLVRDSIKRGIPVVSILEPSSGPKHAVVIDGYQGLSLHFNFGWGGGSNGWYTEESLERQDYPVRYVVLGICPEVDNYQPYTRKKKGSGTKMIRID